MRSGPTQNYEDPTLGRWRPHPVLAAVVRTAIMILPLVLVLGFGLAAAHWLPAARLGVNRWVWVAGEVAASLLLLAGATRLAKHLLPLAGLLRLSLYFPDRAPSRLAIALKRHSPDALRARIAEPGTGRRRLTQEQDHADWLLDTVAAIAAHDSLTAGHSERVQAYAMLVGQELGLGAQDAAKLSWAALLHDVGKLTVPAEIITKNGRPTDEEWALLATHPTAGRAIAEPLADWLGPWLDAIDQHHERWDGGGYPRGLAGTQISVAGRIVAVVDAYDVITSARAYKAPLSAEAAREELARCAGSQFDPEVVRAMLAVGLGRLKRVAGPLSVLSALPGLGSTPMAGLTSISSTVGSVAGVVAATVIGATLGLVGPGALPSDAATHLPAPDVVVSQRAGATTPGQAAGASDAGDGTASAEAADPADTPSSDPTADPGGGSTPTAASPTPDQGAATTDPPPSTGSTSTSTPTSAATTAPAPPSGSTPAPVTPMATPSPTPTGTDTCEYLQRGWLPLPSSTDVRGCDLQGVTLTGDLHDLDFTDADLRGAVLRDADLREATFKRADLTGAVLTSVDLTKAHLDDAILTGASLSSADLTSVRLNGALLNGATFTSVTLRKANLTGANLTGTGITNSSLLDAKLESALLGGAIVTDTSFQGTDLKKATSMLARFTRVDFTGASTDASSLLGAILIDCTLPG